MLGAAPTQWRRRAFLSFAAVVLTVVPLASARGEAARAPSTPVLPAHVWALYVDRAAAGELSSAALRPLRANELNTLIVDAGGMRLTAVQRVEELAKRAGLIVLVLNRPSAQAGAKPTQPRCRRWRSSPSVRCIAVAHTVPEARVLARKRAGALVLLKVTSQRSLAALRDLPGAPHVIAVIDASPGSQLRTRASWRLAVQTASAGDHLHLAFAPPASRFGATAGAYSTLVAAEVASSRTISDGPGASASAPATPAPGPAPAQAPTGSPAGSGGGGDGGGGTADTQAPTAPTGLALTGATQTSISLSWQASTDDLGVTGYRLYQGSALIASTAARNYSFSGLTCGTTYVLGVEAFDAAANDSIRSTASAATSACQSPPPTADTQAPSVPQGMAFTAKSQLSVTLGWQAASDNIGVAGYRLYRNNVLIASTSQLSYAFTGLSCGTSYTFALEAYDAVGNASNRAAAAGVTSTDACDEEPPPPPPPGGGGSASLFVAPGGSDATSCTQAAPCASFDRAYRVASPGAVVQVAAGTYPGQTIRAVAGRSGPDVVFQPAPSARVILGGLSFGGGESAIGPDYITVRDMEMTYKGSSPGAGNQHGVWVGPGATYITLEDLDAGSVSSWLADHLTVRGGDYGPCDAVTGSNVCGNNKQDVSTNVLIEGAYFHDLEYDASAPDAHWECMYLNGGRNVTIRGNRFERCAIFDLFVTISGPDAGAIGHENLTIENNWFAPATNGLGSPSRGWSSLSISWCQNSSQPAYRNVKIRNNSFGAESGIQKDLNADSAGCRWQNVSVTGNIGTYGGCQNGWSYAHNLWVGSSKCNASDANVASLPYVGLAGFNYHLAAGTAAEGFVSGSFCSATDFDGQSRATPCDAGSDER